MILLFIVIFLTLSETVFPCRILGRLEMRCVFIRQYLPKLSLSYTCTVLIYDLLGVVL